MKEIFGVQKKKYLISFFVLLAISVLSNVAIFFQLSIWEKSEYSELLALAIGTFLPVIEVTLVVYILNYIVCCIERGIIHGAKSNSASKLLSLLRLVDIILGLVLIFEFYIFSGALETSTQHEIVFKWFYENIIYPRVANLQLNAAIQHWLNCYLLGFIAGATVLFVATSRKKKFKDAAVEKTKSDARLAMIMAERERQLTIAEGELGRKYEESEFYRQTGVSYFDLTHRDGTKGEYELYRQLVTSNLGDVRYVFNREIPKEDGLVTEADLILLHEKGIFVLENKDYTTKIFGKATDYDLTLVDHFGRKISSYNPIRQNERHVLALKEFLKSKGLYVSDKKTPIHWLNSDKELNYLSTVS